MNKSKKATVIIYGDFCPQKKEKVAVPCLFALKNLEDFIKDTKSFSVFFYTLINANNYTKNHPSTNLEQTITLKYRESFILFKIIRRN